MSTQLFRIQENLKQLKLYKTYEHLESLLEEASKQNLSYIDFLDQLLAQEVAAKKEKNIAMRTAPGQVPLYQDAGKL